MFNGIFRKSSSALLVTALLVPGLSLNSKTAEASTQATVNASALNVREDASTYSKVLGKLKNKEVVTINKVVGKWAQITYNSKTGYVYTQYLNTTNVTTKAMSPTVSVLNVRAGAGTNYSILTQLKYGEVVDVVSQGNWGYFIKNGKKHYVYMPYMKESATKTSQVTGTETTGKVTASKLNIRSSADTYSSVLGQYSKDQVISYRAVDSKWGEVTYNNKKGYVYLSYVQKATSATKMSPTVDVLNVRQGPSTDVPVIGKIKNSDVVEVELVSSKWGKISINGKTGYVYMQYLENAQGSTTQIPKEEVPVQTKTGYVTASALNVRKEANTTSPVLGTVSKDTAVTILGVTNNMAKIDYKGGIGYVSMSYITYTKPAAPIAPPKEEVKPVATYYVNASALNVRNQPNLTGAVVGTLIKGQQVTFVESVNSQWSKIKYNNQDAYVSSQYIQKSSVSTDSGSSVNYASLKGKTVVLDAGHGGKDSGTVGNGLYEKEITLDMVKRVKSKLENTGAKVILTRSDDRYLYLSERANISNNSNAQVFVSIHANSSANSSARGVETFYFGSSNVSLRNSSSSAATNILNELLAVTNSPSRGVKTANFYVIKYNHKPSTLIELGFVSNPSDASFLKDSGYRNRAADAIVKGLAKHFD